VFSNENIAYSMWFYGAADHLHEFVAEAAPKHLKRRSIHFRDRVMSLRLPMMTSDNATRDDYLWAIQEAKELLRLYDEANGIPTVKGQWE
jgi:hypothetical protein